MRINYTRALRSTNTLDPFELLFRKLSLDITRSQGRSWFEQQHFTFLFGKRPVLDTPRHDDKFAGLDPFLTLAGVLAIIHAETSLNDKEHFVFVFVMMPGERPLELHQLKVLPIQFTGNPRIPVVADVRKLFGEIDLFHKSHMSHTSHTSHTSHVTYGTNGTYQFAKPIC